MIVTLAIPIRDDHVLLGYKKRGENIGMVNGFGGKLEDGELIGDCAIRELREESGLIASPSQMCHKGTIRFDLKDTDEHIIMYAFIVKDFEGLPVETDEMSPQWFHKDELPYSDMYHSDREWMGMLVNESSFYMLMSVFENRYTIDSVECVDKVKFQSQMFKEENNE